MAQQRVLDGDQYMIPLPEDSKRLSSARTEHYGLSFWKPGDKFLRSDFNADNLAIDAALKAEADARDAADSALQAAVAATPKVATGTYTGTGEFGAAHPNSLTFPFVPKLVIIIGANTNTLCMGTVLLHGQTVTGGIGVTTNSAATQRLLITWSGKTVTWYTTSGMIDYQLNRQGETFHYFALG